MHAPPSHASWNPFVAVFAALAAVSAVVLLVLQSDVTFFADEWGFLLRRRDSGVNVFLDPHNEHIALAPIAIYKLLLATFGMDSARPFQVVSTLIFLLSVGVLFGYLRRRVGGWTALLGSALILFLGASWVDLLWPFQIGFSGSIAAGLGAMLALERDDSRGDRIACGLLVLSLSFSELGVPFIAGALVGILWVSTRARAARIYVIAVPATLYVLWWLGWGQEAASTFSLQNVLESPVWVFEAASQATASLVGLATPMSGSGSQPVGLIWGEILLVAGVVAVVWRFWRLGGVPRTFWVALAIGGSFWFLTAFNAVPLFREPMDGRYQYPGAVFVLLIAAEALRGVRSSSRVLACGSVLTALAVMSGVWFLHLGQSENLEPASTALRGRLAAIEIARDRVSPTVGVGSTLTSIPAGSYLDAVDDLGSPAFSASEIASSPTTARVAADRTLVAALGLGLQPAQGSPPTRDCRVVAATPSGEPGIAFEPQELSLRSQPGANVEVLVSRFADDVHLSLGPLVPGFSGTLVFPEDRSTQPWRLGLRGSGEVTVCG